MYFQIFLMIVISKRYSLCLIISICRGYMYTNVGIFKGRSLGYNGVRATGSHKPHNFPSGHYILIPCKSWTNS